MVQQVSLAVLATAHQFESQFPTKNECCALTGTQRMIRFCSGYVHDAGATVPRYIPPLTSFVSKFTLRKHKSVENQLQQCSLIERKIFDCVPRYEFLYFHGLQHTRETMQYRIGSFRIHASLWVILRRDTVWQLCVVTLLLCTIAT